MTDIEKAIRHFENIKNENFITLNIFEKELASKKSSGSSIIYQNRNTYYTLAIEALKEQRERAQGCEYCKGGRNCLVDGETTIFINSDDKVFCAESGGDGYLDWKFCPMCSRKLGENNV